MPLPSRNSSGCCLCRSLNDSNVFGITFVLLTAHISDSGIVEGIDGHLLSFKRIIVQRGFGWANVCRPDPRHCGARRLLGATQAPVHNWVKKACFVGPRTSIEMCLRFPLRRGRCHGPDRLAGGLSVLIGMWRSSGPTGSH